ncbi:unnamed protein product [Brassicogethes aeneus]|uniref:Uncharacterized protein n=1 Tax=Brassicogethes aeneus TaxID=1431903 RepID=A0A9P0FI32_BRAAE|nr:unnamed protein product [Brassicogethes aeneus]
MRFAYVLVVVASLYVAGRCSEVNSGVSAALKLYEECSKAEGFSPCLKKKAVTILDRLGRMQKLTLVEGITVVHQVDSAPESITEEQLDATLPRGLDAQEDALDNILADKAAKFLSASTLEISPRAIENEFEVARKGSGGGGGGGGKGGKKGGMMGHMMMMMVGKMASLIPIAIAGLFLLAGKALITAKVALLLAGIIAIKKLFASKHQQPHVEHVHASSHGGHGGWQGGSGGGWDKRSFDEAQMLQYRATKTLANALHSRVHLLSGAPIGLRKEFSRSESANAKAGVHPDAPRNRRKILRVYNPRDCTDLHQSSIEVQAVSEPKNFSVRMRLTCVLAVLFVAGTSAQDVESGLRIALKVYEDCSKADAFAPCLKKKAITVLDRVSRMDKLYVADGFAIIKAKDTQPEPTITEEQLEATLPRALDAKDDALNDLLADKVTKLISSRSLEISLPKISPNEVLEESRGKKNKGGMGMMGGMMMGVAAKMAALIPIAIAGLFLLAGKALITAKIALLLSGIIALKKLFSQKHHGGGHQSVGWQSAGGGGGWQSGGGGWDKRSLNAAQTAPYKAYVPK